MQRAVVVRSHQQGIEILMLAGQLKDQVRAGIHAFTETMLLHHTQGAELLAQIGANRHQTQRVPAGMAWPGELLQVDEQLGAVRSGGCGE